MGYSSIQQKKCKCSVNCPLWPDTGFGGYSRYHAPQEIFEKQKEKRQASIKKSNAKKRDKAKVIKLAVKTVIRPQQRKPINKVSKKRMAELKIYSVLRKDFLIENNTCKCGRNGCKRKANQVHHMKGRENGLLNVVEFWLPVNGICHRWITDHPKEAMELGLIISRLN